MDENIFDGLARSFSTLPTRRWLLRLLTRVPLAAILALPAAEASLARDRKSHHHGARHGQTHHPTRRARHHDRDTKKRSHKRQDSHSEACIPTGQTCPAKKARGKKGKKLGCETCCQGSFVTEASGKKVCGCLTNGGACTTATAASCCSGFCNGSACQAAPCSAAIPCPQCQTCSNTAAGVCEAVANGTACDDGNGCTQSDTCQGGRCVGSNAIVCPPAADQCHDAGICDPATGLCSNPAKPDGATCNDGDLCLTGETCQAGACTGGTPVTCTSPPVCHLATGASCNAGTGQCDYPAEPDGASCGGGQVCCGVNCVNTQTDAAHCGGCGLACPAGQTCQGGICGVGCGSDFCPAASEICADAACQTCTVTCPGGECSGTALQTKLSGGGAVYVCPGRYTGTFTLANNLTIVGAGQGDDPRVDTILDADGGLVTVHNDGGQTVTLRRMHITGAQGHLGGGVENVGSGSSLTMIDCTVAGNTTDDSQAAGVYNENGVMVLTGCTLTDNHARGNSGRGGGGWSTGGTVTMNDCSITANTADADGGGFLNFGDATFNSCTISHNTAGIGGGIRNLTRTIILDNTKVTLNTATIEGGGMYTEGFALLRNGTTITDNVPDNCSGCP